ncbi:MAG: hypothetical protein QXS37_04425 [Candidatus Aenigmatarchaeota archaeon]
MEQTISDANRNYTKNYEVTIVNTPDIMWRMMEEQSYLEEIRELLTELGSGVE